MFENFFSQKLYQERTDLCRIMTSYGSDKGRGWHNYTTFYNFLFKDIRKNVQNVFELGLGTNNPNILSNMGGGGIPCGSLRGWRSYFENANINGADIDRDILVQEDRVKTYYCDQTSPESIDELKRNFDFQFDIIIEDGLHKFEANKTFFENFIDTVKDGGYFIIEDVDRESFEKFQDYIDLNRGKYKHMELVKIPNPDNDWDNNLVVVIK